MLFCVCIPENLYFNYIITERWIDINGTSPYFTTSITIVDPWEGGGGSLGEGEGVGLDPLGPCLD